MYDKRCLKCGGEFQSKRKDAQFCHKNCGYNYRWALKRTQEKVKACPKCRTQFLSKTATYCKACEAEYAKGRRAVKVAELMDTMIRIENKLDRLLDGC
jgi:predicted RNA-binding Zn-ribbon protein involved in translation (DUF1610 family)